MPVRPNPGQRFADRGASNVYLIYLPRCEKLGRDPDRELLGPILEVLQRMQEGLAGDEEGGGQ